MQVIASNKLNVAINSVVKAGAKFGAQFHTVAYSCLALIETSGDVRSLQRLHDMIGGRVTKAALVSWAKAYGKVKVNTDEETGVVKFAYAKAAKGDLEGAALCAPLDFKPDAAGNDAAGNKAEFDFAAKLAALLKAAEKAGAHLQHIKAYQLVVEAEAVLTGANVVTVDTSKEGRAKNKAKAKAAAEQKAA